MNTAILETLIKQDQDLQSIILTYAAIDRICKEQAVLMDKEGMTMEQLASLQVNVMEVVDARMEGIRRLDPTLEDLPVHRDGLLIETGLLLGMALTRVSDV